MSGDEEGGGASDSPPLSKSPLFPAPDGLLLDSAPVYIVSDAFLNKGMSGGPLLDARTGRLLGLNTFVEFELRGLGFALATGRVAQIIGRHGGWLVD